MSAQTPQQMADDLSHLLQERLGIRRGADLSEKLPRARRLLPHKIRRDLQQVEAARARSAHPKLMKQVDLPAVAAAYRAASDHLQAVDPRERRKDLMLGAAASLVVNLLLLAVGLLALMQVLPLQNP